MELTGQRTIPAPIGVTWQALNDPAILKACIPGCESLERTGADALTAVLALRVGPVSARFKGKVKLDAVQAPTRYAIEFEGQGGMAGFGKGMADVTLTEEGTATRLDYTAHAQVGGRLAQVGSRLVDAAAQKLAEDFFSAFEKNVQPAAPEEPDVPAPPIQAPPARGMPAWIKIGLAVAACIALIVLALS
jgi:carbon monoxide dehydrogenase subunit G